MVRDNLRRYGHKWLGCYDAYREFVIIDMGPLSSFSLRDFDFESSFGIGELAALWRGGDVGGWSLNVTIDIFFRISNWSIVSILWKELVQTLDLWSQALSLLLIESLFEAWNLVSVEELIHVSVLLFVKLSWTESSDLLLLVPILSHRHPLLFTRIDYLLLELTEVAAGYRTSLQKLLLHLSYSRINLRNFSRAYSPLVLQDFFMLQCLILQVSHISWRVPVRMRYLYPAVPTLNCLLFDPLLVFVLIG